MIILDTNVLSEPLRQQPEAKVTAWLDAQSVETLYLSTITVAELRFGIAALPAGKRRDTLSQSIEKQLLPLFSGRILPFDMPASAAYAKLMAAAREQGLAIATADGYIAAIASANNMSVATRDAAPFVAAKITVINPWQSPD